MKATILTSGLVLCLLTTSTTYAQSTCDHVQAKCGVHAPPAHASTSAEAFRAIRVMGPKARALFPELSRLIDAAHELSKELSAKDLDKREKVRRKHYGGFGATWPEAKRDRKAVAQALDLLAMLERAGAWKNHKVDGFRAVHDWLLDGINRGVKARAQGSGSNAPSWYPKVASTHLTGKPYGAVFAAQSQTTATVYGCVPASLALLQQLAKDIETNPKVVARGPLSDAALAKTLADVRASEQALASFRRHALELERARHAARATTEDAKQSLRDEKLPIDEAALERARQQAAARVKDLEERLERQRKSVSTTFAQELGWSLRGARAQSKDELEKADPAGFLARRSRGPYFLLLFIDGLSPDLIAAQVKKTDRFGRPKLPYFKRLLAKSARFEHAVGVFPSATIPNTVSILTGNLPERTGIPSNITFKRSTRKYTKHHGALNSRKIDDQVPSKYLFEYFQKRDRFTPLLPSQRGVGSAIFRFPHVLAAPFGLKWPDGLFLKSLRRGYGKGKGGRGRGAKLPARLSVIYLGWFDHVAHVRPGRGEHPDALQELVKYDKWLAEVENDLERLGIADQTYTVLFSDHGQYSGKDGKGNTRVRLDKVLARTNLVGNVGALKKKSNEHVPFNLFDVPADQRKRGVNLPQVVIDVTGNGYAGLYLRHKQAFGSWDKGNTLQDLRAFPNAQGEPVDILAELLKVEGIAQIVIREDLSPSTRARVFNKHGEGVLFIKRGADKSVAKGTVAYRVVKGKDPLAMGSLADGKHRTMREWLAVSAQGEFPHAPFQLAQALAANPDLDVVLSNVEGYSFTCIDSEPNHSDHGALLRKSMRISLMISGPKVQPGAIETPVMSIDILPTVLELGKIEHDPSVLDGRSLSTLIGVTKPAKPGKHQGLIRRVASSRN